MKIATKFFILCGSIFLGSIVSLLLAKYDIFYFDILHQTFLSMLFYITFTGDM